MTKVNNNKPTSSNASPQPSQKTKTSSPLLDALNPFKGIEEASLDGKTIVKEGKNDKLTGLFYRKAP